MSHADLLTSVEIFEGLKADQIKLVLSLCTEKDFEAGVFIFEENTPSTEFYIIVDGQVEIMLDPDLIGKGEDKHEPKTIATLNRGQSFGEIALVDQGLRSASARAGAGKAKVLVIDRENFMALMKKDVNLGFIVMQNLAADLCFKIRNTNLLVREALLA